MARPEVPAQPPVDSPVARDLRVSVVLPAFDEEANIERAVAEVRVAAERRFAEHEIIVVDDGSRDRTAEIAGTVAADDAHVRVISHDRNRGYGEALRTGIVASRLDYVFVTDADLQFDMGEIERLLQHVGKADVIAGYRLNRQDPLSRRLLGYAWNRAIRILFRVPLRDVNCAFKLLDNRLLSDIDIESTGALVNAELMVKLGRKGARLVEVGVHHRPRLAGEAGGGRPRVIVTAVREVVEMRRRLGPLRD